MDFFVGFAGMTDDARRRAGDGSLPELFLEDDFIEILGMPPATQPVPTSCKKRAGYITASYPIQLYICMRDTCIVYGIWLRVSGMR